MCNKISPDFQKMKLIIKIQTFELGLDWPYPIPYPNQSLKNKKKTFQ